ncbi:unnamed protein product [Knipowitschia caucasica]
MASVCVKISCAFVLVLMLLAETDGAGIPRPTVPRLTVPRNVHLHKHNTSSRHEGFVPLQLNTEVLAPAAPLRSLQNSSISPWTYDYKYDESLYPSHSFAEARCLLSGCLNLRGTEDSNLSSRLIKHQVLQLRRVKSSNGTYYFRLEQRLRAVGCTCVRNTYIQQE